MMVSEISFAIFFASISVSQFSNTSSAICCTDLEICTSLVISYADRLILVRPVSVAVIAAFSVWYFASACSLSTAKVTLPGTRSSVTLSSSGAYWCTFSMMVFAVWVGTSGPAEAVAVDHARCSVSVSSLFASVFSHAERYSSLERSYSRCSGAAGCGWNVRISPPAPFAILFSRLRRCSA